MTIEWRYRCTPRGTGREATMDLLEQGILCRTAHNSRGAGIANVSRVGRGDRLHVAFAEGNAFHSFGTFRAVLPAADSVNFQGRVGAGALARVREGSNLARQLEAAGYTRDPYLHCFTAWALELEEAVETPAFDASHFPGNNALHRHAGGSKRAAPPAVAVVERPVRQSPVSEPRGIAIGGRFTLPSSGTVLGVDWSGAADAGRKIWAAHLRFTSDGAELIRLERPFINQPARTGLAKRFGAWLSVQDVSVAGLDFCFSLPTEQLQRLGLEAEAALSPQALGTAIATGFRDADAFRVAAGKEAKRATDRASAAPFAPTNLRMFRQTYLGLCSLAATDASFPPWVPVRRTHLTVVEVLPAQVARAFGGGSYKGPSTGSVRRSLLTEAQRSCRFRLTEEHARTVIADDEGDALDAILAAFAAGSAQARGFPAQQSPEGFIFGIA